MYKKIIESIIPNFIISFIKNIRDKIEFQKFKKLSLKETFETIYNDKLWTPEDEKRISHFTQVLDPINQSSYLSIL